MVGVVFTSERSGKVINAYSRRVPKLTKQVKANILVELYEGLYLDIIGLNSYETLNKISKTGVGSNIAQNNSSGL